MKYITALTLASLICLNSVFAESFIKHLPKNGSSPAATIEQVSWIEGHWQGEAFGGVTEEIWSPPQGGSMMASFRLIVDN